MTVEEIAKEEESGSSYLCGWFEGRTIAKETYEENMLARYKSRDDADSFSYSR